MCAEPTKTQKCTLVHNTGIKFNVNLTTYELQKAEEDEVFATEMIEKYFKLYKNNLVSGAMDNFSNNTISIATSSNLVRQGKSEHVNDIHTEGSARVFEEVRGYFTDEDDELLISMVSARPPLYDMRLPLRERAKDTINSLWEEVISELNITVTVKQISSRWKNIRDSYMRARANITKKIASGSSAEDKIKAESIKLKHKNYTLLQFLDDTLTPRSTSTNVADEDSHSPSPSMTPTSRGTKRSAESADELFFKKMDTLCESAASTPMTSTQHFCMRLADSLQKLPLHVKNKLEIEFFQKVCEAEEMYSEK